MEYTRRLGIDCWRIVESRKMAVLGCWGYQSTEINFMTVGIYESTDNERGSIHRFYH